MSRFFLLFKRVYEEAGEVEVAELAECRHFNVTSNWERNMLYLREAVLLRGCPRDGGNVQA